MFKKFLSVAIATTLALSLFACSTPKAEAQVATSEAQVAITEAQIATIESETAKQIVEVNLEILKEQDDSMINTYSILAVNDKAPFVDANGTAITDVKLYTVGANALINWFLSEGLDLSGQYGFNEYGEYLFYIKDDAPKSKGEIVNATDDTRVIKLSTTTSVNDSGLLGNILPKFEEKYGYKVEVYSAGTGKAIANAKAGNADVILVHAKAQEDKFVEDKFARIVDGFDKERLSFMYNFFVLCGPKEDKANVKNSATVLDAFKAIADGKYLFVSRGDGSGTHTKELALWPKDLGITAEATTFEAYKDWYISSNAGMGACLLQASEKGAYILSDKATFLTFKANGGKIK
ncbi:MAG: substrate-binding domain-containing protein [Eubacteriales bacterium]|nr:substrate-binding domain-containing protein [Eubacteriales bacterium]